MYDSDEDYEQPSLNSVFFLIAIRECIHMRIVEECVISISPGKALRKSEEEIGQIGHI